MRFNCGPTPEEKREALQKWHKWFALLPRRLTESRECVCLEFIERKGTIDSIYGWMFEYREIPNEKS